MRTSALTAALSLLTPSILAASSTDAQYTFDASSGPVYGSMSSPPGMANNVPFCIHSTDAAIIGHSFGQLISNYSNALAVMLLAEGFVDQADSVNTLINSSPLPNQALGSLTFDSKQAFLDGQGAQPPVPFDVLNTWNTCDTVIIRWVSHQQPDQVQGISIGVVQPAKEGEGGGVGVTGKYQLRTVFAEFNSGAWLNNLGKPECKSE